MAKKKITPKLAQYMQNIKKAPALKLKAPRGRILPMPLRPLNSKKNYGKLA